MRLKIMQPTIVDVKYLKVRIERFDYHDWTINYNELESPEQHPFYVGKNTIEFAVDVETGKVLGWNGNNRLETFDKVVDEGIYSLCDKDFNTIVSYDGYVPKMLDRKGDGYGDYLQFVVNEDGYIENWVPSFKEFDCEILN